MGFLSLGEALLIGGFGMVALAPHNLPTAARIAGKFAGASVHFMRQSQEFVDVVVKQYELHQISSEVSKNMEELYSIRRELQQRIYLAPRQVPEPITNPATNQQSTVSQPLNQASPLMSSHTYAEPSRHVTSHDTPRAQLPQREAPFILPQTLSQPNTQINVPTKLIIPTDPKPFHLHSETVPSGADIVNRFMTKNWAKPQTHPTEIPENQKNSS